MIGGLKDEVPQQQTLFSYQSTIQAVFVSFIIQNIYQRFVLLSVKTNLSIVWGGMAPCALPLDPPLDQNTRMTELS